MLHIYVEYYILDNKKNNVEIDVLDELDELAIVSYSGGHNIV